VYKGDNGITLPKYMHHCYKNSKCRKIQHHAKENSLKATRPILPFSLLRLWMDGRLDG